MLLRDSFSDAVNLDGRDEERKNRRDERLQRSLSSFSSDSSGELNVLWHDCDSLGVDGAQVCVFEKSDEVRFGGFL